jgi:integrase
MTQPVTQLPPGIRRTPTGFQTYRWRKDPTKPRGGYQASKRWKTLDLARMKAWIKETELRGKRPDIFAEPDVGATTFADDARAYLQRDKVQTMPTHGERERHIKEWGVVFGHRDRKTIEPHHIQAELDRLRGAMSAGSVNKRRTALMDLWTTLDGKHQANPVKGTKPYEEPHPEPRAPELANVLKLLKAMPAKTDYGKKCLARLKVITWTGWPHAIVKTLEPADFPHWKQGKAFIRRRKKGKGARARWLPLLPEAKAALLEFHKADAYGHFSNSSLWKRVQAASVTAKIPHMRVYDLRHFFLTLIAVTTRDERAVMELGLISTPEIARRYTEAATDPRVQAAVTHVASKLPGLKRRAKQARKRKKSAAVLPTKRKLPKQGRIRA